MKKQDALVDLIFGIRGRVAKLELDSETGKTILRYRSSGNPMITHQYPIPLEEKNIITVSINRQKYPGQPHQLKVIIPIKDDISYKYDETVFGKVGSDIMKEYKNAIMELERVKHEIVIWRRKAKKREEEEKVKIEPKRLESVFPLSQEEQIIYNEEYDKNVAIHKIRRMRGEI